MSNFYITKLNIGVDSETGLDIELRVKSLIIDASIKKITIRIDKCLVSPTGVELKITETLYYDRYNSEFSNKYDALDSSPIGLAIKQILDLDLLQYPNLNQY